MSKRALAVLQLLATALLWSLAGVLIKSVDWSMFAIAGGRSAIAALFLLAVAGRPRFTWSKPQVLGAVGYAVTMLSFVSATRLTSAANAILLQYTAPLYVALAAPKLLGEPTRRADWLCIGLALCGMTLFFLDDLSSAGYLGNCVALLSGLGFASIAIFLRKQKDDSTYESVLLGNIITALVCFPAYFGITSDAKSWGVMLFMGIVQTGLSYYLYSKAIRQVRAVDAMLIPIIEPLLNPVWVFLVIGEAPGRMAVYGGILVISAVAARALLTARELDPKHSLRTVL